MAQAVKNIFYNDEGCDFSMPHPVSPQDRFVGEQLDYMRSLHSEASDHELRQMILQEWSDDLSEEQKSHYLEEYEDEIKVWQEEHDTYHSDMGTLCDSKSEATNEDRVKTEVVSNYVDDGFLPRQKVKKEEERVEVCTIPNFELRGGQYICLKCGKMIKDRNRSYAMKHSEKHLEEEFHYICPKCFKVKRDKYQLKGHLRADHGCPLELSAMEQYKVVKENSGRLTWEVGGLSKVASGIFESSLPTEDIPREKTSKSVNPSHVKKKAKKANEKKKSGMDPQVARALAHFQQVDLDKSKHDSYYTCLKCGKNVKAQYKAVKHYEMHMEEAFEFACPKCGKVRKDKFGLQKHMRVDHGLALDIAEMAKYKRPWTGAALMGAGRPYGPHHMLIK